MKSLAIPKLMLLYIFSELTSMSRGRRVILCMGRMRKEIIGRFLQSGWASILVSTSLNTGFLDLQQNAKVIILKATARVFLAGYETVRSLLMAL